MLDGEASTDRALAIIQEQIKAGESDRQRMYDALDKRDERLNDQYRRLEDKTDARIAESEVRQSAAMEALNERIGASDARQSAQLEQFKTELLTNVAMNVTIAVDAARRPTAMSAMMDLTKWALLVAMAAVLILAGRAELIGKLAGMQ